MPYIRTVANVPIPGEQREKIKTQLGAMMPIIGKKESQLMVDFCENSPLYFQGSAAPAAIVGVDVSSGAPREAYDQFSVGVTHLLMETLGLDAGRIFIKLAEYPYWALGKNLI